MKKLLLIVVSLIAGLGLLAGLLFGGLALYGHDLDTTSRSFVERTDATLFKSWETAQFDAPVTLELGQNLKRPLGQNILQRMPRLGAFQSVKSIQGEATILWEHYVPNIKAHYVLQVHFEKEDAEVQFYLLRVGGEWKIDHFSAKSPALLQP